jgi:hypothetical protein
MIEMSRLHGTLLTSDPVTQFGEGNLNAILISSSKGGSNAAAAQSSSRKLTIVKR